MGRNTDGFLTAEQAEAEVKILTASLLEAEEVNTLTAEQAESKDRVIPLYKLRSLVVRDLAKRNELGRCLRFLIWTDPYKGLDCAAGERFYIEPDSSPIVFMAVKNEGVRLDFVFDYEIIGATRPEVVSVVNVLNQEMTRLYFWPKEFDCAAGKRF